MKKLLGFLLIALSLGLFSQVNQHNHAAMSDHSMQSESKIVVNKSDLSHLDRALENYRLLHQAFAQYNGEKIHDIALKMKVDLDALQDKELVKLLSFSAKTLGKFSANARPEENKTRFHVLSMALIHVANKYQLTKSYQSFYCPMVKMKWLQPEGEELHNPYSSEMPSCGEKL